MDSCRVCMFKPEEMSYIFDENCDYSEKILYCTGIQISKEDGLPSQICKNCIQDLAIAYKFKSSCILAQDTFQSLLKNDIKTEIEYDNLDDSDGLPDHEFWNVKDEPIKAEVDSNVEENDIPAEKTNVKRTRGPYKKKNGVKMPKKKYKYKKLWCYSCKINFKTSKEKETHQIDIHNNEIETFVCEHCGKVYNNKGSLYSHALSHLPPRFACDMCDYKATYRHDLTKHLHIHAGIKMYQCQICANRFRTSSTLSEHIRREHEKGPKRYPCGLCEKGFFDKTKYMRHMDSHNNIKRFECEICKTSFTRRCYWKKHRLEKHNIVMPRQRPGRQREELIETTTDSHTLDVTINQIN